MIEANNDKDYLSEVADAFGQVHEDVIHQIVPDDFPVSIHVVEAPSHLTLITSGMRNYAMPAPEEMKDTARAELFIHLPNDWPWRDVSDPNHFWPISWLQELSKIAFRRQRWLGAPVAVFSNERPDDFLSPDNRFTGMLAITERKFNVSGNAIQLYRLLPLYWEEIQLEQSQGFPALLNLFDQREISAVVNKDRPNVAI